MDIMMPSVREQPAPAPWLLHQERINVPRLICELTSQRNNPTPQQIQEELKKRDVDVPRDLITLWMTDCKTQGTARS